MQFKVGNTKVIAGKFFLQGVAKVEVNFEYVFKSWDNYRRFANVVSESESKILTINIKSKFSESSDCDKLAQLLMGVSKITTQDNIEMLDQILEDKSAITLDEFVALQQELTNYFL